MSQKLSKTASKPRKECTIEGCTGTQTEGYERCCKHIECRTDGCTTYARNGNWYCISCQKKGFSESRREKVDPNPSPGKDENLCTYSTCPRTPDEGRRCSAHKKCLGRGCTKFREKLRKDLKKYCRNCKHLSERGELQEESDKDDQPRPTCPYEGCDVKPWKTIMCGIHKPCATEGCPNLAQRTSTSSHCIACGGGPRCEWHEGCDKAAIAPTKFCVEHGGGERCKFPDCPNGSSYNSGYCKSHGGTKKYCKHDGCPKKPLGGGFCTEHGGLFTKCKHEGCPKKSLCGGFCSEHGGKFTKCKYDRCPKKSHKGGYCVTHGGLAVKCKVENCERNAKKGGCCQKHGGGIRCNQVEAHHLDDFPPIVYYRDFELGMCMACCQRLFPGNFKWCVRREQFIIAEIDRLCPWLSENLVEQDCPIDGGCSLFRPDCLWDMDLIWLAIEVDEKGHDQNPRKYPNILRDMGDRPGLLIRINPDLKDNVLFARKVKEVVNNKNYYEYTGTENFEPFMEEVAELLEYEVLEFLNSNESPWTGVREIKLNFE